MRTFAIPNSARKKEHGSMLLELLISMVILVIGLGGLMILLVSVMYTNNKSGRDTTSTMVAEHILEQISSQPANAVANLTLTDCAGTVWNISTLGAIKGGGSGVNGGNGAALTSAGIVDWTQNYGERNKDCLQWTDTCVNCVRAQSGESFSCSNIGIACQPKEVACVTRAEEKVK